jgi:hypothetical protein
MILKNRTTTSGVSICRPENANRSSSRKKRKTILSNIVAKDHIKNILSQRKVNKFALQIDITLKITTKKQFHCFQGKTEMTNVKNKQSFLA